MTNAAASTDPGNSSTLPWWLVASLVLAFPVGVFLLLARRGPSPWKKFATAAFTGVIFAAWFGAVVVFGFSYKRAELSQMVAAEHRRRVNQWLRAQQIAIHRWKQPAVTPPPLKPGPADPATDWPGFRGPLRDSVARSADVVLPWPEGGPKLLWRQPIGGGQSSFAIVAGRAFTLEQRAGNEVVTSYLLKDGTELWAYSYSARLEAQYDAVPGPHSTPTVADGRVYAQGATGRLTCLNADSGALIWQRDVIADSGAKLSNWGLAGSPWVERGRVYVLAGGPGASLMAYDATSGEVAWRSGDARAGYSSLVPVEIQGVRQFLAFDGSGLTAYAPQDGRILWTFPWETQFGVNTAQPIVVDDQHVLITSEYGAGCALIRIAQIGSDWKAEEVWSNLNLKVKYSGAILYENKVYGPDGSIFSCLDPLTGERCWKGGRYGYSFPILINEYLIVLSQQGNLVLLRATPEGHEEISSIPALEGDTANHPAFSDGKLLIRNSREMMCFDLTAKP